MEVFIVMGDNLKKDIINAYNTSLKFLGPRPRSIKEVRDNLYKKKFKQNIIEQTIILLKDENLINDEFFTMEFIAMREKLKPKSKFALRYELRQKGISDLIIDNGLKDIDENKSALAAIKPKLPLWQKLDRETMKKKMMNFLNNRGFSWEKISTTYDTITHDTIYKKLNDQEKN